MVNLPFTGGSDYGINPFANASITTDFGDVSARLMGYALSDATGRIIVHDDFADGLARWTLSKGGTGVNPALSTAQGKVFSPPNAVILDPSAALNDYSQMAFTVYQRRLHRVGFETMIWMESGTAELQMGLFQQDSAANLLSAILYYDAVDNEFEILSGGQQVTALSVNDNDFSSGAFVPIKLVVDFQTQNYVRLLVGGTTVDLTAYSIASSASSGSNTLGPYIRATNINNVSAKKAFYVGYATVTLDEP